MNVKFVKELFYGSLTDVVEMDAASNNSVEDIRGIREEVNFLPTKAKYRVYIIDEVHMLSTGAFNALLKTLEEPPMHVKFILATTEPQKLPATILSRCQRFDFKKISNIDIIKRLKIVCSQSNIEITDEALNVIAVFSEGAMRDALSILERCIQDGENKIDDDKIKDLIGIPKTVFVHNILSSVIKYDVDEALKNIDIVLDDGKDIVNLLWELIKYIKDVLVYKSSKKLDLYNEDEIKKINDISETISKERLVDLIYKLSELENETKWATQKTIMFQAGIIKLCNKQVEDNGQLNERIEKIEKYLKSGKINVSDNGTSNVQKQNNNINASTNKVVVNQEIVSNTIVDAKQNKPVKNISNKFSNKSEEYWPQIVTDLKQSGKIVLYTNLINTRAVELNDMTVGIEFPKGMTPFGKAVLEKQENIKELSNLVSMACGKEMNIKYVTTNNVVQQVSNQENLENLAKQADIPFNVID